MTPVDKALVVARHAGEHVRRVRLAVGVNHPDGLIERLSVEAMRSILKSMKAYESLDDKAKAEFDQKWPAVFASIAS